jgi:hypothetical protein
MNRRKRFILYIFCLTILVLVINMPLSQPVALAAGGQLAISGQTSGHSGTAFHIDGSGFIPDGFYNLYATMDATRCIIGSPNALGLQAFTPAIVAVSNGAISQDLTWPTNIDQAGAYYLCLANAALPQGIKTVSSNTFTVAAAATLDITPNQVMPGQGVTLSGLNWLPVQQLDVAIVADNDDTQVLVENKGVQPDATGSFTITFVIPGQAGAGNYTIRASAANDQALMVVKKGSLTVIAQATPTPSPTAQPSPTPTPIPTIQPSPTTTPASATVPPTDPTGPGSSSNSNMSNKINLLIFGMAGLGVLFILIGAVIFAVSMQIENEAP